MLIKYHIRSVLYKTSIDHVDGVSYDMIYDMTRTFVLKAQLLARVAAIHTIYEYMLALNLIYIYIYIRTSTHYPFILSVSFSSHIDPNVHLRAIIF